MVKMPRFETSSLETGVKTIVTETGQQLPPSYIILQFLSLSNSIAGSVGLKDFSVLF